MKKIVPFLFIIICNTIFSQQVQIITSLTPFTSQSKWDAALNNQMGVMGTDYDRTEEIGFAPAEAFGWYNTHFPKDGFKRTICGQMEEYYIRAPEAFDDDDDVNFCIIPMYNSKTFVDKHNFDIARENFEKFGPVKEFFSGIDISPIDTPDFSSIQGIENYNTAIKAVNSRYYQLNTYITHFLRLAQYIVTVEIDMKDEFHSIYQKYYFSDPKEAVDCICSYGAWVDDQRNVPMGSYHDYIEIHPADQVWWSNSKDLYTTKYNLLLMSDNSDNFNNSSDFDADGSTFFGPWQSTPLHGTFAIPFEINLSKNERLNYDIRTGLVSGAIPVNDGKLNFLSFRGDTLIKVREYMDNLSVSFNELGYAISHTGDTLLRGFTVLRGSVDYSGVMTLVVTAVKTPKRLRNPILDSKIKVTLRTIECIGEEDDGDEEEFYGHSYVAVYSPATFIPNVPILPVEGNFRLLERPENYNIDMKQGAVIRFDTSRTFKVSSGYIIKIFSNLDEDDGSSNGDRDDGDDKLDGAGKNVEVTEIKVDDLMGSVSSKTVEHVFYQGGTRVKLTFFVERSGNAILPPDRRDDFERRRQ